MHTYLISRGIILVCCLLMFGCVPSFKKFRQTDDVNSGFIQHRVNANGNAVTESKGEPLSRVVFERKLNSAVSAQIVGNSQFIVVPTYNKRIYFLNPQNGDEMTALVTESAVSDAAALRNELLYYAEEAGGDRLVCFNLVSGKIVWQQRMRDPQGAPIIEGDEVLIGASDGDVFCLNRWTGDSVWVHSSKRTIYPTVSANSEIVVFGTDSGEIVALDRKKGERLWSFSAHGAIYAQALIEGLVYCGSADGSMYALQPKTGELVWKFETTNQIHTTPVLVDGRLVFGSDDNTVYCLSATDGGVLWKYETSGIVHASPIAIGRTFVVANSAGGVYQFGFDGTKMAEFQVRGSVEAPPAFINGMLYIGTTQRRVYAFGSAQAPANVP
ncbi:MAG: PQQ-binding-like beta-propeller repeat protein [bacterium]|nr:PQQ-binding-like beta-propeller repeat protein [bacterium]